MALRAPRPTGRSGAEPQRFTLRFKNGQLLRHQDGLTLAQFRSDGRLAAFWPETSETPTPRQRPVFDPTVHPLVYG
ncbi:hypothetical protein KBZ20_07610 [Vulcanococcus limneticus Candia 3F8]|uniref:hypothetical protein n=1 Tax=Vulcanococcus limneticus TaxID=2170428 RepID=UPI000B98B738|nr:hypothetical protein [Vulcanococcus limneticus]MCP9791811.1 hypothetical protein [Vulcanococcus limneticus MW73D5]MCP9893637.1 hypothetical protein [Vulcanococcus limneticus Candia 3F8]MCP9897267.1 hypothetical protein [Vulcanococcus limneticus Candia 3B3]